MDPKIIETIVTIVISGLATVITEMFLGTSNTTEGKTNSKLKSFLIFTLKYALPIALITRLMIISETVDKYFVLSLTLLTSLILLNICTHFFNVHLSIIKQINKDKNMIAETQKGLINKVNEQIKITSSIDDSMSEILKRQLKDNDLNIQENQ